MEYKKLGNKYVLRLDPGDEIISCLHEFANKEGISCAEVRGLGAVNHFVIGLYDLENHAFVPTEFNEMGEITSLWGTLSLKQGSLYHHLHMSCGLAGSNVVGGHLIEAVISGTGEIVVDPLQGLIEHRHNEQTGLEEFNFC